jgi:hypothetical protein
VRISVKLKAMDILASMARDQSSKRFFIVLMLEHRETGTGQTVTTDLRGNG